MNKLITILLFAILCFVSCKEKEEDVMNNIKKKQEEINKNLKDYKQKNTDYITNSAGNGTITGYYRDDEIRKIYAEYFSETGRTFSAYYFDDGMLILIVKQEFIYNHPISYTEEKAKENHDTEWYDDRKTKLEINMFYFNKNKLIKWHGADNKDIPVSAENFTNKESELWAETLILIKELKEQNP